VTAQEALGRRVTVVIPNWNGLSHLEECFAALDAQAYRDFEVVFVDNDSADQSVEWVRTNYPTARVISRPDNGGFAKAVNAGVIASTSEYVALLNNDTLADSEWLSQLVDALDANACFDFAASLMLLYYEPGQVNAAGDTYSILKMSGVNRGLGKPIAKYLRPCRVLGACAGASFYRRSMFDDVGLFDEDFFLLHEDTDINLRALVAGKKCLYVPSAVVRHKHHGSIGGQPQKRIQVLEWRNKATAATKSLPWPLLGLAFVLFPFIWLRWTFPWLPKNWALAGSRVRMAGDVGGAVKAGVKSGLAKREGVMVTKRVTDRVIVRWVLKGTGDYEECKSS
jgi:GT2 family glycosyltransferase